MAYGMVNLMAVAAALKADDHNSEVKVFPREDGEGRGTCCWESSPGASWRLGLWCRPRNHKWWVRLYFEIMPGFEFENKEDKEDAAEEKSN